MSAVATLLAHHPSEWSQGSEGKLIRIHPLGHGDMMRNRAISIFGITLCLCAATQARSAVPAISSLNLVCSGEAEKTEYTISEQVRSQSADVRLYLTGDGGTAEIPRFIGGAQEGRQSVRLFTVSDTMITGKINYQTIGNAKMRIDRVAGTVSITGPRGNFSGRCQPFDPARASPKF